MSRAERNVLIIKLVFLAIFAVICVGLWWYHFQVVEPRNACLAKPGGQWFEKTRTCRVTAQSACEAGGGWWDPKDQVCGKVVYIPSIIGKKP